jgi:hypothetical protein
MSIEKSLKLLDELASQHGLSKPYIVGGVPRDQQMEGTHDLADIDITTGDNDVHTLAKLFAETVGKDPIWQNNHFMITHNDIRYDFAKHEPHPEVDDYLRFKGIKNPSEMLKEVYSRDFTINTLMMPMDQGDVIDLTGRGVSDIKHKILSCPISCGLSFKQDPKRILRAFYFKTKYDFEFSEDVSNAIDKNKHLLGGINRRYAAEMINKVVREDTDVLDELIDSGILQYLPITKYINSLLIQKKRLLDVMEQQKTSELLIRRNLDYGDDEQEAEDGKNIIDPLDTAEYCDSEKNRKYWKEMGGSPAAEDFQKYIKDIKCTSLPVIDKQAMIRGPGVRQCPFGLPISTACKNAGSSVDNMIQLSGDERKMAKQTKLNKRVYIYNQTGERCVYADKIVEGKDKVHCDFGDGGQRISDFPIRPSPFYPRVFHGLGQYGLYSYPVNDYMDASGARQMFSGIFSLYASTGEVLINKTSFKPDPVLEKLVSDIAIKDE